MKYRLGLDVGTNSLGWSVLGLDDKENPITIKAAGSRIFSDGREVKSKATLAATRRDARSARRRRDRFKQRQQFLLDELTKMGLLPEDKSARNALKKLNPLELRARSLSEKLEPHEIGRALFHLNQRRGFKSNRKDRSEETLSGKVSNSVRNLLKDMGLIDPPLPPEEYKELSKEDKKQVRQKEAADRLNALEKLKQQKDLTFGSFLYGRHQKKKHTRARPSEDGKLYDVYPQRELYEDEFNKIWEAQAGRHADLMTDKRRERIRQVIFTQRPLKPQERGQCVYMNGEKRTFRAMPSFQHYRIYQEVNSLEWTTAEGRDCLVNHPEARDAIVELHQRPGVKEKPHGGNAQISFHKMKTILKEKISEGGVTFNFETPKRKGFDGNQTSNVMQHEDYVGALWHDWDLEKQDKFIGIILDDELDDAKVKSRLISEYGLSAAAAEKCMNAPLVDGTANISLKAARLILGKMRDGVKDKNGRIILPIQPYAVVAVEEDQVEGFKNPMRRKKSEEGDYQPEDEMPYYGKWFQNGSHIIPGLQKEEDKHDDRKYWGGITNPTVHIAMNQIRQVVNELIRRFGHPHSIAIELGRELPTGADGRREIENEQKKNQDENERFDEVLKDKGVDTNRTNRLRLRLWEELGERSTDRRCPFSGKVIGIADLFNGAAEIEHLIPFSMSLDDSRANKVICTREANRYKGERTPFDAFGSSSDGYNWDDIFERTQNFPKAKQWRFREDALEIWNRDCADFSERHLNDTRYIGRLAREYLESICHIDKINVLPGRLTALLRGHWGLNSILKERGDDAEPQEEKPQKKNRDDHRHHAIDAIVIGMTTRSILQKVATEAKNAEELDIERLFPKSESGKSPIDPWDGFREEAKKIACDIIVSHKPSRKKLRPGATDGQLHNETALGLIEPIDERKNQWKTVVRRPIDYLKERKHVNAIRDDHLREEFLQAFDYAAESAGKGVEGVQALARERGIRRLRCFGPTQAIPICDEGGKRYKGYQGDSNWGIEIYAFPEGHKKADKWEGVVISSFEANKSDFQPGTTCRPEPTARLVMRLQINDCVEIVENGHKRNMRLQKVDQPTGPMYFASINEANVAARHTDKEDKFKFIRRNANSLKELNPRKIHISPTGQVSYEKRRKKKSE